jgi:2-polyprenyl-6-hydroxyphenyl methylase/3-demethylubiquinone-9 3-methyltransferase
LRSAVVSGLDAAEENIAVAKDHADSAGLVVDYTCGEIAQLNLGQFDLVSAMEVIEHVADKRAFIAALISALKPGGLLIISTPNRTIKSRVLLVEGAERLGAIPRGTHHWDQFITPHELRDLLKDVGLVMDAPQGIAWTPLRGLHLSDELALNYIVTAKV